jgi:two-component system chemotaxis sensor kinase CheA
MIYNIFNYIIPFVYYIFVFVTDIYLEEECQYMSNGMDSMLSVYLYDTGSLLEKLDEILLESEKEGAFSQDNINEIFRIMHTIKGSSAMMEFNAPMTVAHKVEDLFYFIRQQQGYQPEFGSELFSLMFKCSDFLREQIEHIQNNEPIKEVPGELVEEIVNFLKVISGENAASDSSGEKDALSGTTNDKYTYCMRVFLDEGCGMENLRSFMLVNSIKDLCDDFIYDPEDVETNNDTCSYIIENGFTLSFPDMASRDVAVNLLKGGFPNIRSYEFLDMNPAVDDMVKEPIQNAEPDKAAAKEEHKAVPEAAAQSNAATHMAKQSLISVNLSKLDKLLDIVGEIVITESMVTASPDIQGLKLDNFTKSARQLRKLTDELQDIAMSARMVPVAGVFQKMNRIVRDMSHSLNKDVKLTIIGDDTEVDKNIVDSIGDPIMHMVRNSMDHGIEKTAADRVALGKNPQAEIVLEAQNTGSEVIITIKDDGRGVDVAKVLTKAKDSGLLVKPENEYTQKEILQFLLMPGFSTKSESEVTEFSGRGVGMDVVKKNIEKLGGTVTMSTKQNEGTCTVFKIPLTLAIVEGMEVAVGKSVFTIPISNVKQSFRVNPKDVAYDINHREMIARNGEFYGLLRLHELYGIDDAITDIESGIIMWLESGDRRYCLLVDELIGKQQVVVKPLPAYLNEFDVKRYGIAGCTILGDGSISIILDAQDMHDAVWTTTR